MSNKAKKPKMFSMDLENVRDLLEESKQQLEIIEDYMRFYLDSEYVNKMLICLLSEYYSCNYVLIRELKKCIEYCPQVKREDKEELVLTDENLSIIESSAVSRYLILQQLTDYNVSTYFN